MLDELPYAIADRHASPARARRRRPARRARGAALAPDRRRVRAAVRGVHRRRDGAAARRAVRPAADGSELYPRHDVGARGARAHPARPRARSGHADRRHDRVGQHRHGGRSHAPRRPELRAEAVGGRHAARDPRARGGRGARGEAARSQAAARARGRAADSARPAADERAADRAGSISPSRGSPPTASAATASTRWRLPAASASRSPTSRARVCRRRC